MFRGKVFVPLGFSTSGKRAIGGAFFFLCVAHMECATNGTPLVTVYWWRIFQRILLYAPLVAFENSKISKNNLKIEKNQFFFENHKNRNNVKKLLYLNFLRILSHEEHFQITPNFLTSR
jgi:hypothetical protein